MLEGNWPKLVAKLFQKYHTPVWTRDHVTGRRSFDLLWPLCTLAARVGTSLLGYILSPELRKEFVSADWHPPGHPSIAFLRLRQK